MYVFRSILTDVLGRALIITLFLGVEGTMKLALREELSQLGRVCTIVHLAVYIAELGIHLAFF